MRIGDSLLTFGLTDTLWGWMQNLSIVEAMESVEAKSGQAVTKAVEQFNKGYKVTGTYTYRDELTTTAPGGIVGSGTTISLSDLDVAIYINSATNNWTSGDWKSVDFDGFWWPSLGS